jgi:hypothetical protein|nr:MAG TPA: hypothetical protein [Caudoviricetes sp.]
MTDRERIYNLVDKVCDLSIKAIDKITELKQENSKLKQRVAELEKPKKKRKFRAMTNGERGKEMTNFEKIKEKNIEEMAKFLISFYFDVSVNSAKYTNMEKWLQSEVEE